MKNAIILGAVLSLFCVTASAQTIYRIKNVMKDTYLGFENGRLSADLSDSDSQALLFEFSDAGDGDVKIKHIATGSHLNIEHGEIQNSRILEGWLSARWRVSKVEDSDYYRIGNLWKPEWFINTQNGLACSRIEDDGQSAAWALETVDPATVTITNPPAGAGIEAVRNDFLARINAFRRGKGLNPVKLNEQLNLAAQVHSDDMASKDNLAHAGSNGSSFGERIRATGYSGSPRMENIALAWSNDAEASFRAWENSPGHNRNMSNSEITSIGYAIERAASGKYYATLVGGID